MLTVHIYHFRCSLTENTRRYLCESQPLCVLVGVSPVTPSIHFLSLSLIFPPPSLALICFCFGFVCGIQFGGVLYIVLLLQLPRKHTNTREQFDFIVEFIYFFSSVNFVKIFDNRTKKKQTIFIEFIFGLSIHNN